LGSAKGITMASYTWVINTHKNLPYLKLAIQSIRRNAFYKKAPIIVYCENDDETALWLADQTDILSIIETNPVPKGIGGGVNEAMKRVSTSHFSLIHSDMFIAPGYDTALIDLHDKLEKIGKTYLVSATRIEPDIFGNPSSRPGTIIVPTDAFGEFHHNFDIDSFESWANEFVQINPEQTHRKLEGVSYFGRTEAFLATGGNDPLFAPASYEDHDLSIRMMCMGYDFATTNKALVYHFGSRGAIFRDDDLTKRHPRQIQAEQVNRMKWMRKWGSPFEHDDVGFVKLTDGFRYKYNELYANRT
jgi:GT2 family glycosyltransferase